MQLPESIHVELTGVAVSDAADVLVALDLQVDGRYYYGSLIDNTDANGRASASAADIATRFQRARDFFLADYRVPIENCDPRIVVRIIGDADFLRAQRAAATNEFMEDDDKVRWATATNSHLQSAEQTIDLTSPAPISVTLRVRLA